MNCLRTLCIAMLSIGAVFAAAGCNRADVDIAPAPPEASRESKVALIAGSRVHMTDGSAITLPDEMPRTLMDTRGLTAIDAQKYTGGAMLSSVCGEPAAKLAARLDLQITAQDWQIIQSSDSPATSSRSYRKGNWVMDVSMRSEQGITYVTTQMETADPAAPAL